MPLARAAYAADMEGTLRQAGIAAPPGSPERQYFEARLQNNEPIATFALTNSLAAVLAPWIVLAIGVAATKGNAAPRHGRSGVRRFAAACFQQWHIGPIAVCLALTKSRSSGIAALAGLGMIAIAYRTGLFQFARGRAQQVPLSRRERAGVRGARGNADLQSSEPSPASPRPNPLPKGEGNRRYAVVAILLLVAAAATAWTLTRPENSARLAKAVKSFGFRVQYWQATAGLIADHPLLGCGPGNFQDAYTAYKLPEASEEIADPHNFLLEVWATAGTPAMLAMLTMLACFFRECASANSSRASEGDSPIFVGRKLGQPPGDSPKSGWSEDAGAVGTVPWPVFAGGLAGFFLAVPLGQLAAAPPGIAATLVGLPLAAGCLATLTPWVRRGRLLHWLPAVGVAVMLINLSAAGGIGQPGVAGSFWLLLALGLHGRSPRCLRRALAAATLAAAIGLAIACFASGYSPVLRCETRFRAAERELLDRRLTEADADLSAAAAADPAAVKPWHLAAELAFQRWRREPSAGAIDRFDRCIAAALARAPRSAGLWRSAGDCWLEISAQTGRRAERDKALTAYRRAAALYPNNALCHAQLALAHRKCGDQAGFRRESAVAIDLDRRMPHAEKKLPENVRHRLSPSL